MDTNQDNGPLTPGSTAEVQGLPDPHTEDPFDQAATLFSRLMAAGESRTHGRFTNLQQTMVAGENALSAEIYAVNSQAPQQVPEQLIGGISSPMRRDSPGDPPVSEPYVGITGLRFDILDGPEAGPDKYWQYKAASIEYQRGIAYIREELSDGAWITAPDQPLSLPDHDSDNGAGWHLVTTQTGIEWVEYDPNDTRLASGTLHGQLLSWDQPDDPADGPGQWKPFAVGELQVLSWLGIFHTGKNKQVLRSHGPVYNSEGVIIASHPTWSLITPDQLYSAPTERNQMAIGTTFTDPDSTESFPLPDIPAFVWDEPDNLLRVFIDSQPSANKAAGDLLELYDTGEPDGLRARWMTPFASGVGLSGALVDGKLVVADGVDAIKNSSFSEGTAGWWPLFLRWDKYEDAPRWDDIFGASHATHGNMVQIRGVAPDPADPPLAVRGLGFRDIIDSGIAVAAVATFTGALDSEGEFARATFVADHFALVNDAGDLVDAEVGPDDFAEALHAPTHKRSVIEGDGLGTDMIRLDELGTPLDTQITDATITAHGLLPKLNNNSATFLSGAGTWLAPAGGVAGSGVSGSLAEWTGPSTLKASTFASVLQHKLAHDDSANQIFPLVLRQDSKSGTHYFDDILYNGQVTPATGHIVQIYKNGTTIEIGGSGINIETFVRLTGYANGDMIIRSAGDWTAGKVANANMTTSASQYTVLQSNGSSTPIWDYLKFY